MFFCGRNVRQCRGNGEHGEVLPDGNHGVNGIVDRFCMEVCFLHSSWVETMPSLVAVWASVFLARR